MAGTYFFIFASCEPSIKFNVTIFVTRTAKDAVREYVSGKRKLGSSKPIFYLIVTATM